MSLIALSLFSAGNGSLLTLGLASAALFFGGKLLFRRDEAREDRRRKAISLCSECREEGLGFLAPLLEDYAVGDYSSAVYRLRTFHEQVKDGDARRSLMDNLFARQLAKRIGTAAGRAAVLAALGLEEPAEPGV